jgi:trimeric autotransporter adhesin
MRQVVSVLAAAGCLMAVPVSAAAVSASMVSASMVSARSPAVFSRVATRLAIAASAPDQATAGTTMTLTATVTAADGTRPAGSVQFTTDGTDIGSPVAVTSGAATATTTFATAGRAELSAMFIPASTAYRSAMGAETLTPGGAVPLTIAVPQSGLFSVTVAPGTVNLAGSGLTATGTLQDITVTDTRNYYPGWSGTGQESSFTGSGTAAGSVISGGQLGWVPAAVEALQDGASLGSRVAPVSPGLGSAPATLALAPPGCGFGTNVLSASLTLAIPPAAVAGPYLGSMTITFMTAGPQNEVCAVIPISA